AVLAKNRAQRLRDLAWRQRRGGHLIQQRLEQVVVDRVNQQDAYASAAQGSRGIQAAEAAAHDDDRWARGKSHAWRILADQMTHLFIGVALALAFVVNAQDEALPDDVAQVAVDAASAELGVSTDNLVIASWTATDWPDSSLGCPEPGHAYAQVLTPGYL